MSRTEIYREVSRLDRELTAARAAVREAQLTARVTGVKMAGPDYASLWDRVHRLERALVTMRLQGLAAQETVAERLIAILKDEHPEVFSQIARQARVE